MHLLCGLLGAGKTTYAKQLATDVGGVRFTLDEWMLRLYGLRHDDPRYVARLKPCQESDLGRCRPSARTRPRRRARLGPMEPGAACAVGKAVDRLTR